MIRKLLLINILCQVLDFLFTYTFVLSYGTEVEANPFVRILMDCDPLYGLLLAKLFAINIVVLLYSKADEIQKSAVCRWCIYLLTLSYVSVNISSVIQFLVRAWILYI